MRAEVSILTPSFGYGRFIGDAIESVLGQNDVQAEHIIQDGGSTDETLEILGGCTAIDWVSEVDEGQSDALNKALSRASAEWIGWLNADEYYLPGALKALINCAMQTNADVVYGDVVNVDAKGRFLRLVPQHTFSVNALRYYGPFIDSCAALFRRTALGSKPWRTDLARVMDWDLYLRLSDAGARFSHVAHPCGVFRVHSDQVTATPPSAYAHEHIAIAERHRLKRGWRVKAGCMLHSAMKVREGAYQRQVSARCLRGYDLRWMASDEGMETFRRLHVLAYENRR